MRIIFIWGMRRYRQFNDILMRRSWTIAKKCNEKIRFDRNQFHFYIGIFKLCFHINYAHIIASKLVERTYLSAYFEWKRLLAYLMYWSINEALTTKLNAGRDGGRRVGRRIDGVNHRAYIYVCKILFIISKWKIVELNVITTDMRL